MTTGRQLINIQGMALKPTLQSNTDLSISHVYSSISHVYFETAKN